MKALPAFEEVGQPTGPKLTQRGRVLAQDPRFQAELRERLPVQALPLATSNNTEPVPRWGKRTKSCAAP